MADARATAWSGRLTDVLGVEDRQLPRIVAPSTLVGGLTRDAAQACGLAAGTPIAAGLGDTAAATLGAGVVQPGQLLDVAGTATILAASTDRFAPDATSRTLIAMHGAVDDQWVWLSYFSGGSLLPWLADALGLSPGEGAFDSLVAEAATADAGCHGLVFVPHLDGRLLPSDPSMTGSWMGLGSRHGRPELIRSVLESVAYEYAGYLAAVLELDPGFRAQELRAVGGGARSPLWNDIKASVLGIPLGTLGRDELSCWGAALVAGHAVGVFDDLGAAAERATRIAAEHAPDAADHETYNRYLPVYRDALDAACGRRAPACQCFHTQGGQRVNELRLLVVGAGRAGALHAANLSQNTPRAGVIGVVDSDADRAGALAAEVGAGHSGASLDEALAVLECDAVVITTPTFLHRDLAVLAARAGRHVFCEKPMALDTAECDQMIDAAAEAGVTLQIGFMRRFQPEFAEARRRIAAGDIGEPMVVKSLTRGPGLPPPWAWSLERSNGLLAEVNSHDFDCVRWLAGSDITRVYAEVSNLKGAEPRRARRRTSTTTPS